MLNKFRKHKYIYSLIVIIVVIIIVIFYTNNQKSISTNSTSYQTQKVSISTVSQELTTTGSLQSGKSYNSVLKTPTEIKQIYVSAGDNVKSGDKLYTIDSTDLHSKVQNALIALNQAKINLKIAELNAKVPTLSNNVNVASDKLNQAKSQFSTDTVNLSNATLKSDRSGIVTQIKNQVGDNITSQNQIIGIVDYSENIITAQIPEANYLDVSNSTTGIIVFDAKPSETFQLTYITKDILPTQSATGTTYGVKFKLVNDPQNLQIGMNGDLTLNTTTPFTIKGTYNSSKTYWYSFSGSGKITTISVSVGQNVTLGSELAKLDIADLQSKLNSSKLSLSSAEIALQQANNAKNTDTSTLNLDIAKQKVLDAENTYNDAKSTFDNATVISPIDGVVTEVKYNVGDTPQANTNIMSIVDTTNLQLNVNVGESDVVKLGKGMLGEINFDAITDKKFIGKVNSIDMISTTSQNVVGYGMKILLTKFDSSLKIGMSGTANILVKSKDNALSVPNAAIKTNGSQKYVQILENNSPKNVNVEVGMVGDTRTEIISGLAEGTDVIVSSTTNNATTSSNAPSLFNLGGTNQRRN